MVRPMRNRFAAASRLTCSSIPCRPPRPGNRTLGGAGSLIDFQPLFSHRGRAPPRRGRCTAPDGCLRPRIFAALRGPFQTLSRCRPGTALWSTVAGTQKAPAIRRGLGFFSASEQRKPTHYLHARRTCAWYNRHVALKPRPIPLESVPQVLVTPPGLPQIVHPPAPVAADRAGFFVSGRKTQPPPPHRRYTPASAPSPFSHFPTFAFANAARRRAAGIWLDGGSAFSHVRIFARQEKAPGEAGSAVQACVGNVKGDASKAEEPTPERCPAATSGGVASGRAPRAADPMRAGIGTRRGMSPS